MKNTFLYLLICLFVFSACNNEAKLSYEQIQSAYTQINNNSPESIKSLISQIDNHIEKYPSYEKNDELESLKINLSSQIETFIFAALQDKITECYNHKFDDYDEAISAFSQLKDVLNDFVRNSKNSENISYAQGYIERIDSMLQNISQEQTDFEKAIYSNDASDIETFLANYPNSIMRTTLLEKMDQIYFSEFMSKINLSPNSIIELNNSINKAKSYLENLQNFEVKAQIVEIITQMESKRRQVLEVELSDKLQDLIESMEEAARHAAKNKHPTYEIQTCVTRGSNPEIVGNSSTIERVYQVNMKGAFLGIDKREMEITVIGRIKGDINRGVSISVTGTRIMSDTKY